MIFFVQTVGSQHSTVGQFYWNKPKPGRYRTITISNQCHHDWKSCRLRPLSQSASQKEMHRHHKNISMGQNQVDKLLFLLAPSGLVGRQSQRILGEHTRHQNHRLWSVFILALPGIDFCLITHSSTPAKLSNVHLGHFTSCLAFVRAGDYCYNPHHSEIRDKIQLRSRL